MKKLNIVFYIMLLSIALSAQESIQVYDNQNIKIFSENWQDSIVCEIAIPDSWHFTDDNRSYPLLILFDQQNKTNFNYHLAGINLLTGVGAQIPEIIVTGLPFDPDKRLQYTDAEILRDSLSGLESTARLIFNELIPAIEREIAPVSFLMIAGHSRTAWLVNYLLANYPNRINAAGSFSGFFESDEVKSQLLELTQKPDTKNIYYLMTSGESYEEQTYLLSNKDFAEELSKQPIREDFRWEMIINREANHISNYALSVPQFLTHYFADYNTILGEWFDWKQDSLNGIIAAQTLENDFIDLPYPLIPQLVHIYSLASHYYNQNDFQTAIYFIEIGLKYYPKEPGLKLFEAELYALSGNHSEANMMLDEFDELIKNPAIKLADKNDLYEWYESIKLEMKE
jgi:predicted alpha/beta superfamily hydrolase